MNRIKTIIPFFILCLFSIQLISKVEADESLLLSSRDFYNYFDTSINIQIWDENKITSTQWNAIEEILRDIQYTFKRTEPASNEEESELHKLNASAGLGIPYETSDDLYEVIKMGINFAEETNGKFEPSIGPLVDLWDINNPDSSHPAPSNENIQDILSIVDYKLIEMNDENKTVYLPHEGMVIDLGAIAKGYAADKLVEYLNTQNVKHALIYLGGNLYAYGNRYTQRTDGTYDWRIGIEDPRLEVFSDTIGSLYVQNKTVVTSGLYERYIIDPDTNKMYHHILDPDTGYPVDNNLVSVTIITESSAIADALSTSTFSLGLLDGIDFIENYDGAEAVFITDDNKVYITSGVSELYKFQITNSDFEYIGDLPDINIDKNDKTPTITAIIVGVGAIIVVVGSIAVFKKHLIK